MQDLHHNWRTTGFKWRETLIFEEKICCIKIKASFIQWLVGLGYRDVTCATLVDGIAVAQFRDNFQGFAANLATHIQTLAELIAFNEENADAALGICRCPTSLVARVLTCLKTTKAFLLMLKQIRRIKSKSKSLFNMVGTLLSKGSIKRLKIVK